MYARVHTYTASFSEHSPEMQIEGAKEMETEPRVKGTEEMSAGTGHLEKDMHFQRSRRC